MEYTHLGRTGLLVSRLVLGTMNFGTETSEEDSHRIMDRALEHGINFFDTANVYGWRKGEGLIAEPARETLAEHVAAQRAVHGSDVWAAPSLPGSAEPRMRPVRRGRVGQELDRHLATPASLRSQAHTGASDQP
jgi:diketogulonate reductase-like aldo/keto reductase